MKKYHDFFGTIIKKSHSILFGYRFTLQNSIDTLTVSVGKGLYETYPEGVQLQIGHIGRKLINIKPAEKLTVDATLWNAFIDTLCSTDVKKLDEMNEYQKNAVLSFQYDTEVNSGGHTGYFDIYSGINYTDVIKALDFIGAAHYAGILKSAVQNKNDDYNFETEDNDFYASDPYLSDILMKYVISHREDIDCVEE